ncbi:hypothetical protein ACFLTD_03285 [Elusimicrobiota bacterium]
MIKKKDTVMTTMTLSRHNRTVMRLLEQHNEEIQLLRSKISALEREIRNLTAIKSK